MEKYIASMLPLGYMAWILMYELNLFSEASMITFETKAETTMDMIERNLFERYGDVQAFASNSILNNPETWLTDRSPEATESLTNAMNTYSLGFTIYTLC